MDIKNVSTNSVSQVTVPKADVESKTLQSQIATKQQSLKRLSSDVQKTKEEKEKESEEIRQQIEELNRRLKMLQMEKKKERAEQLEEQKKEKETARLSEERVAVKETAEEESQKEQTQKTVTQERKEPVEKVNVPADKLQKMLAVDSLWQQERLQNQVARKQERREESLATEIKSDTLHGNDNETKKKELSEMRRKEAFDVNTLSQPIKKTFVGSDKDDKVYTLNHI